MGGSFIFIGLLFLFLFNLGPIPIGSFLSVFPWIFIIIGIICIPVGVTFLVIGLRMRARGVEYSRYRGPVYRP
jgi:hypothetical protein